MFDITHNIYKDSEIPYGYSCEDMLEHIFREFLREKYPNPLVTITKEKAELKGNADIPCIVTFKENGVIQDVRLYLECKAVLPCTKDAKINFGVNQLNGTKLVCFVNKQWESIGDTWYIQDVIFAYVNPMEMVTEGYFSLLNCGTVRYNMNPQKADFMFRQRLYIKYKPNTNKYNPEIEKKKPIDVLRYYTKIEINRILEHSYRKINLIPKENPSDLRNRCKRFS